MGAKFDTEAIIKDIVGIADGGVRANATAEVNINNKAEVKAKILGVQKGGISVDTGGVAILGALLILGLFEPHVRGLYLSIFSSFWTLASNFLLLALVCGLFLSFKKIFLLEANQCNSPSSPSSQIPTGTLVAFASETVPEGWLLCDGQHLNPMKNPEHQNLFRLLYSEEKGTSSVPDLRGRSIIGAGKGPGLSQRSLFSTGGLETVALDISQMPRHSHTYSRPLTWHRSFAGEGKKRKRKKKEEKKIQRNKKQRQ